MCSVDRGDHETGDEKQKDGKNKQKPTVDRTRDEILTTRASSPTLAPTAHTACTTLQRHNIRFLFLIDIEIKEVK